MIDHLLGRPDQRYRKYQIIGVVAFWLSLITKFRHGPRLLRRLTRLLTPWQLIVLLYLSEYLRHNFADLMGLESPEPMAHMYSRSFFRATYLTTALDAGFWRAMWLRPMWLRNMMSMVFSFYYIVCPNPADEFVHRVRGKISLEHLRVSWNKPMSPVLLRATALLRPPKYKIKYKPRTCRIPRPPWSEHAGENVTAMLYYVGSIADLKKEEKLVLDVPGGGFVAMNPRCYDDKLMAWAALTRLPILAVDYGKAPEYPYPYALQEIFEAYWMIMKTSGRCVGFENEPRVVVTGDSAGGNLAAGLMLKIAEQRTSMFLSSDASDAPLPMPDALILIYPALEMNITSWLTPEQTALMSDPARSTANKEIRRRPTEDRRRLINTPYASEDEAESPKLRMTQARKRKENEGREVVAGAADPALVQAVDGLSQVKSRASALANSLASTTSQRDFQKKGRPDDSDATILASAVNGKAPEAAPFKMTNSSTVNGSTTAPLVKPQAPRTSLEMTSMIAYVNDRILTPQMLRAMIMLYISPERRPDFATDHFLSPLRAPENLLAEFPKVWLMCGERDPLIDDTVLFSGRLRQAHLHVFQSRKELGLIPSHHRFVDEDHVHTHYIPGVSHGFLQLPSVYPEAWEYIEKCSRWIQKSFADFEPRETPGTATNVDEDYFKQRHSTPRHRRFSIGGESSENEDQPLEMFKFTPLAGDPAKSTAANRKESSGRGGIKKSSRSGRRSPVATRAGSGLARLRSSDNLIARRMQGLAGGLLGHDTVQSP